MLIQAHYFRPSSCPINLARHHRPNPVTACPLRFKYVSGLNGVSKMRYERSRSLVGVRVSASVEESSWSIVEKKRKVVEHVCLLKAKEDLSQEKENNMLDYLYTTQYQMGGILSISLGRISNQNDDNYTHAVYMRFQRKEDLVKFYEKPFYLGVLKEHVLPYCHGLLNLDYESEVEDDILPIFRKGEEFNYGVEFVLLISFMDNAIERVGDALACLQSLIMGFPSLVVQSTHVEAFQIFESSSEYKKIWKTKFEPITRKTLSVYYLVDPVGTEIM
ncbi:Stress responsive alpha-beta barrel [Parasponia andersonii]|uniref:Stress responsive alpha-beta barrel n=1 Tax=Parasponia andersonii TaxID=3476 RepID=A0A2P5CP34_PARAD|nr:Stress responsive alpha-beta barrel [Parasponia andersonii]